MINDISKYYFQDKFLFLKKVSDKANSFLIKGRR